MIADYDSSAVRLIDSVNRRTTNPETKGCPIIPTIIILTDNNEKEALEHLRAVGGVTKIVKQPFQTKDLLYMIIDVLTTQKKVEETFKSLTKKKIISSKYPYMPIFDTIDTKTAAAAAESEEKQKQKETIRKPIKINEHASVKSGASGSFASYHEHKMEEIDEGTECSSLLPEFVNRIRKEQPEMNSPYRQQRQRELLMAEETEEERLQAEAAERVAWRQRLMSGEHEDSASLDSAEPGENSNNILTTEDPAVLADSR